MFFHREFVTLLVIIASHSTISSPKSQPLEIPFCSNKDQQDERSCSMMGMFHSSMDVPSNFSVFGDNYQRQNKPPLEGNSPLEVKIALTIITILGLSEVNKDLSLEVMFRVEWKDKRLRIPEGMKDTELIYLHPDALEECLWIPDAYLYHLKDLKTSRLLTSSGSLMIDSNQNIIYTCQMLVTVGCYMDFSMYPVDSQECRIKIASYSHTTDQIRIIWNGPISLLETVYLDEFQFDIKESKVINEIEDEKGVPIIEVVLVFHRFLSFHLFQTYIPSVLLIVVAWLSLFIPREMVPGRMLLCMTTLITLTTMLIAVRDMGPRCSYLKAIDIWMLACIIFDFFSLSQYALILRWNDTIKQASARVERVTRLIQDEVASDDEDTMDTLTDLQDDNKALAVKRNARIDKMEVLCIITYPVVFILFNLVYWSWVLSNR